MTATGGAGLAAQAEAVLAAYWRDGSLLDILRAGRT